jgi:hypothetical protein
MARHTTGTTFTWKNELAGRCAGGVSRLASLMDGRALIAGESFRRHVSRKSFVAGIADPGAPRLRFTPKSRNIQSGI